MVVYLVVTQNATTSKTIAGNIIKYNIADYHWYRQDKNGKWSHKPGSDKVKNVDANKSKIYDPSKAAKSYIYKDINNGMVIYQNINYKNVGFFKVTKK